MLKFKYKSALVNGDTQIVDELLEDKEPWIDADDATSTEWINLEHTFTKSRVLFTEPCRKDPISLAAGFGNAPALKRLLDSDRFDPRRYGWFALKAACTAGHLECARLLLHRLVDNETLYVGKALGHAAFMGHAEVVRLLLSDGRCVSEKDYQQALLFACRAGHLYVVRLLLSNFTGPNPNQEMFTEALLEASKQYHADVVFELLRDGRSDPTASNFLALRQAIKGNNMELIKALICFGPDEYWTDGLLFRLAIKKDHRDVLVYLMHVYQLEARAIQKLFRFACSVGSYHCALLLLKNEAIPKEPITTHATTLEVDFGDHNRTITVCMNHMFMAIHEAASHEHKLIIRLLLKDGRFDEAIPEIIGEVFRYGWYEIGRLFLAHPSISAFWLDNHPNYLDQGMLIKACKMDAIECINSMLVPITMDDLDLLLRCSISHGHISSFASYLEVLNLRFEEISGERAAEWLETLDYCTMFIIRDGSTELALDILKLLGIPLGDFLDHENQERDLETAIRYMEKEGLPNLQELLELYIRHLAIMTIMDEYGLRDLWHQIITCQLQIVFSDAYLKFKAK